MSKSAHTRKRNYGRSLLTREEIERHVPWYRGAEWSARKAAIERRVKRRIGIARERARLRSEEAGAGSARAGVLPAAPAGTKRRGLFGLFGR